MQDLCQAVSHTDKLNNYYFNQNNHCYHFRTGKGKDFVCISTFNLQTKPRSKEYYPNYTDEKTEAQEG